MKQEQRLVAELYRYLAPFIDTSKDVFVSLDGQAALMGVKDGQFVDGAIPDLWFTIVGRAQSTRIEAKALDPKGYALLMQGQLQAWRTSGTGGHKPDCWVAVGHSFDAFYLWEHRDFLATMDRSENRQKTVPLSPPASRQAFGTVIELALAVLHRA